MRGERDPIEKYGVSMNDASIRRTPWRKVWPASTEEMTPQIKAAAALDLLFEQTADSLASSPGRPTPWPGNSRSSLPKWRMRKLPSERN